MNFCKNVVSLIFPIFSKKYKKTFFTIFGRSLQFAGHISNLEKLKSHHSNRLKKIFNLSHFTRVSTIIMKIPYF